MKPCGHVLIFGASTRAAAFSALRAGMRPWCADLFADRDLDIRCPVVRVPPERYPEVFFELACGEIAGPWMYTGALENRPSLVQKIAKRRLLWGNDQATLGLARSPCFVTTLLKSLDLPCPAVSTQLHETYPPARWLTKPLKSAGGSGIGFARAATEMGPASRRFYFQQYVEGDACSAVFVGDGRTAKLLGVTRQLVGEAWLHASPFRYCGSIGPMALDSRGRQAFEKLGLALAAGCGLRGLFGIDCIMRAGVVWPVEINPRYTASVEVIEYATRISALALHASVFDQNAPGPIFVTEQTPSIVGKAILFAKESVVFPEDGPWLQTLSSPGPIHELPAFADIPHAGELIEAGKPILSLFERASSMETCLNCLQGAAARLDRTLFGT